MITITKLLCDHATYGDELRYRKGMTPANRRPIVVWNCSRRCNLSCIHCYLNSANKDYANELSTEQARRMIDDLAAFKVPVLLFSGGEPLMRRDLFELNDYARGRGIRTVISTNGTLINEENAKKIKAGSFDYVGVSLDAIGENNDRFRGTKGAFEMALKGIRNLVKVDQKVGLRFTITRHNYPDLKGIFELVEREEIERICFYHLVYVGRGSAMTHDDLPRDQMRDCVESICSWAESMHRRGIGREVLTVDNHCDAIYVYLRELKRDKARAAKILELLQYNKGNASGIGIANVDNEGNVHADQFWRTYTFGNVKQRPFGEIWMDTADPLMAGLKDRKKLLKGRCARCRWLELCNGNFRARGEAVFGDVWMEDPACYLTDDEIRIPGA
ncbi:MAG: radical SAM protein [Deltaproteobacteria bacterium]